MDRKIGMGWLPLLLLSTLGYSGTPTLPIWLTGASEQFHFTPLQGGLVASLELGCLAAVSIAWATLSRSGLRVSWLGIAIGASIAGNLGSSFAPDISTLIAMRVLVGLSYGLVLAEITRRAAQMPNSHRVFAMQQLGLVMFVVVFFSTSPAAIAALGSASVFLYTAVLGALALVSLIWLPKSSVAAAPVVPDSAGAVPIRTTASGGIALALIAVALIFMAQGSVWTYITSAAKKSGLGLEGLGMVLAIGALFNLISPLAAERVGLRLGRAKPLVFGHIGLALSVIFVAVGANVPLFSIGAVGLSFFLLFLVPFALGTLADLDKSGRSASAGPAFFTIGGAIAPALGGAIITTAGFVTLGILAALTVAVAMILALVAASKASLPGSARI
jgi:predicted MFS family arabinose efflux permease